MQSQLAFCRNGPWKLVSTRSLKQPSPLPPLEALDDEDRATAKLYVKKAAQAADEAWQHTVDGYNEPIVTNPDSVRT